MMFLAAWAWVKKYWQLLTAGLLVLAGVLFGVSLRKRQPQTANPVKEQAEHKAETETRKAEYQAAEKKAEALEQHDADLAVVVDLVQQKTDEVRTDVGQTNTYLQDVSKVIRGED